MEFKKILHSYLMWEPYPDSRRYVVFFLIWGLGMLLIEISGDIYLHCLAVAACFNLTVDIIIYFYKKSVEKQDIQSWSIADEDQTINISEYFYGTGDKFVKKSSSSKNVFNLENYRGNQ